jgi:C4-dicarboxylate-specific signal transduction histidine kinase
MDELLVRVSRLPANSAIYYLTLFADGDGQAFVTHDALRRIVKVANVPVYVSVDQYIGTGAVGGNVYSVASLGTETARLAARVLRGEAPSTIAPLALAPYVPMFDWRQLQRWNIDMGRLPAGSVVQERRFTAWEAYGWYIVGGVSVILLQTALVIALLLNNAQRRRAELARQESEQRRRRAEEEVQRQREELAHALRLTTLGELTASIAHELNQPLTAIAANAQAANRLLHSDRANPDLPEALEDLENDSFRAAEIIQRLQVLFRKQPGSQVLLDMNAVIDDVLRLLANDLRQRQIEVNFARSNPGPKTLGDSVQMRQVILNLLRNAEEAIARDAGGPRQVSISIGIPDETAMVIEIRDSGVGVGEAELERMFEHFVSSKPQGLGLGLAISRSIVEAHGGRIWATRNPDRGITMHVQLPVSTVAN